jgi:DNA-binding PadR family transcriptional regulator
MDIQYALLSMLNCRPMTGYDLKKAIQESAFMHWSGNNNQIYKALLALQEEGLTSCEVCHQDSAPSKKIYSITEEGRGVLKDWLKSAPEPPEFRKEILIRLISADMLSPKELAKLMDGYENEIRMQEAMQQEKLRRGNGFEPRTPREALLWRLGDESILASLQSELEWIRQAKAQLVGDRQSKVNTRMEYTVIEAPQGRYMEVLSRPEPIRSEQDALDLVALCGEHDTNRLMLHAEALSEEFFRLRTGVAGAVLQKLINYSVRTAVVVPDPAAMRGKFSDMAAEAGRGRQFRVFDSRQEAEDWLLRWKEGMWYAPKIGV